MSCSKDALTAQEPDEEDPTDPVTKAYTIQGSIKNASGNPVKNARIRVKNPNGNNIHYTTRSDEYSKYSVTVSAIGGYKIYALKEVKSEGQIYQIRLGIDRESDYDAFSVPPGGVTKNFVWKLSGVYPTEPPVRKMVPAILEEPLNLLIITLLPTRYLQVPPITVKLTPKAQATYLDGTSAKRQSGRKVVHHHSRCRTGLLNQ